MIVLSILIPTIPERAVKFTELYNEVMAQKHELNSLHPTLGDVEVLIDGSKKFLEGGLSIGKKRESLVNRATGKYLLFLDDDENIAPNYLETLVRLCQHDVDVVTFRAFVRMRSYWGLVDMRLGNDVNEQMTPDNTVNRTAWHTCPVKSVYAKMFPFPDISDGEDFEWMQKVLACCTTEAHTDKIIFCYNHGDSEADKITQHESVRLREANSL